MPLKLEQSQGPGRVERFGSGVLDRECVEKGRPWAWAFPAELLAVRMGDGRRRREKNLNSVQGLGGDAQLRSAERATECARARARKHPRAPREGRRRGN